MITRFRSNVGRKRLGASIQGSTRAYTQSARTDMKAVIKEFQRFVDHVQSQEPEVLKQALEPTFAKSQKYVPKDTGKLEASGYLETTTFRGRPTVEIGYGKGGEPDYAAAVHENLEWRHKAPTKAKFLADALKEDEAAIQKRLIEGLRQAGGL